MCTRPLHLYFKPNAWQETHGYKTSYPMDVPCGHCCECLQRRQNGVMARIYNEAINLSKIYLVTLTYKNEKLPLAKSLWAISKDTGEYQRLSCPEIIPEGEFVQSLRSNFANNFQSDILANRCRVKELPIESFSLLNPEYLYVARITPSISSRDVMLVMHRWRKNWKTHYGPLPKFRYCACGEFGKHKTCRPHYHFVFLGSELTEAMIRNFAHTWEAEFGSTDVKVVRRFSFSRKGKDGRLIDGFSAVSKYIGKYVAKGPFDVDAARDGLTCKMRLLTSKGLGTFFTQESIDWYTCQDLKRFDIHNASSELSEDDRKLILPQILQRMTYSIVSYTGKNEQKSFSFGLPTSMREKIFGTTVLRDGKKSHSELWYLVQDFVRNKAIDDHSRQLEQLHSFEDSKAAFSTYLAIVCNEENSLLSRETVARARLYRYYQTHSKI